MPWPSPDPEPTDFIAEQRAANDIVRANAARMPAAGSIDAATIRRNRLYDRDGRFRPALVESASDEQLDTRCGSVLARRFPFDCPIGLTLHFHGGGWSLGSVYEQDGYLTAFAAATRATCLSIDYPLAPDHRLPHILDVAEAVIEAQIRDNLDIPICVAGESAGAHIALQSVLRLRRYPELFRQVRCLSLTYGIYDLSMTPSQRSWGSEFLGLSTDWLEWFYEQILPDRSRDERSDPALSPLYADLTELPPAIISVGRLDPLLDDSLFLFERYRAAGNKACLHVYPEAPHGFNHAATRMGALCNKRIFAFVATALGGTEAADR